MQKTDHGHPVDPDRLCESLTKRGRACENPPVVGQRLCADHGGQVAERQAERARIPSALVALDAARDLNDRIEKHRIRDAIKHAIEHGVDPDYIEKCIEKYRKRRKGAR